MFRKIALVVLIAVLGSACSATMGQRGTQGTILGAAAGAGVGAATGGGPGAAVGAAIGGAAGMLGGFIVGSIEEKKMAVPPLSWLQGQSIMVVEGQGGFWFPSLYTVVGERFMGRGARWIDLGPFRGYDVQPSFCGQHQIDYLVFLDTFREYGYSPSQSYAIVVLRVLDCRSREVIVATKPVRDNIWRRFNREYESFAAVAGYAVETLH